MLQGLLLVSPECWPRHLSEDFKLHHYKWIKELQLHRKSQVTGAIEFIKNCSDIDAVLIGVTCMKELREIVDAWRKEENNQSMTTSQWNWDNVKELDPRQWPTT